MPCDFMEIFAPSHWSYDGMRLNIARICLSGKLSLLILMRHKCLSTAA